LTYRCATNVYPNSKGLYDFIVRHHFTSKNKLKIIANGSSNGIDTSFFSPDQISGDKQNQLKQELDIRLSDFVFIFVGRLVDDKGINELVKAFSLGSEQWTTDGKTGRDIERESANIHITHHSSVKLLLVGPLEQELDPLLPETLETIRAHPGIISVNFQQDVRPYFAIADALVFPSYREGFPNVVMQAGAMGLPCIVTDINGCNEIIIDGENGVIIPSKDEQALYKAMDYFICHPEEVRRMAGNARPLIAERYEQQRVWEALLEEYNRLLSE
jgi:Glycosyltransferase